MIAPTGSRADAVLSTAIFTCRNSKVMVRFVIQGEYRSDTFQEACPLLRTVA